MPAHPRARQPDCPDRLRFGRVVKGPARIRPPGRHFRAESKARDPLARGEAQRGGSTAPASRSRHRSLNYNAFCARTSVSNLSSAREGRTSLLKSPELSPRRTVTGIVPRVRAWTALAKSATLPTGRLSIARMTTRDARSPAPQHPRYRLPRRVRRQRAASPLPVPDRNSPIAASGQCVPVACLPRQSSP